MALSQDSFNFGNYPHGMIEVGPWESQIITGRFFGVQGEGHLLSGHWGRDLSCELTINGVADIEALNTAIDAFADEINQLTGTLTVTIATKNWTFPKSTFLGFTPTSPPFFDGSGVHDWVCFGRLSWRQRDRS